MDRGKVKWYNVSKGWGFIEREDGEDVFFHFMDIVPDDRFLITENRWVEFDSKKSTKSIEARNVRLISEEDGQLLLF